MDSFCKYLKDRIVIDPVSNCWNWNMSLSSYRYGVAHINGEKYAAHRASYSCFIGEIPKGKCVCHKCDNTQCINPDHLFLGSQKENMIDASFKGKFNGRAQSFKKGEDHRMAKLSESDVLSIIKFLDLGMTQVEIGKMFKIKQSTVSNINVGKRWKQIGEKYAKMQM